MNEKAFLIGEV